LRVPCQKAGLGRHGRVVVGTTSLNTPKNAPKTGCVQAATPQGKFGNDK
jgi:hypothetical protein